MVTDNEGNKSSLASSPTAVDYAQLSGVTGIDQTSTGHYTSPTSYTFSGHAAGSAGATDVKSVEIYDGTNDLGAATVTAATGAWTYSEPASLTALTPSALL